MARRAPADEFLAEAEAISRRDTALRNIFARQDKAIWKIKKQHKELHRQQL